MKKVILALTLGLLLMNPIRVYSEVFFSEDFETGISPFSFTWKWTKSNAYNEGSLVDVGGARGRCWREIFKPGSTDTYFGFFKKPDWRYSNTIYCRFYVRYGDAAHPYVWSTAARSHELKFPDFGEGSHRSRILAKHRRGKNDYQGIFRIYTPKDARNHDAPVQLQSNVWYCIQFMVQDNGSTGDVVKIWINNDDESRPSYSFTAGWDMFESQSWETDGWEFDYRNHAVARDQYFYFDDIEIGNRFLGANSGTRRPQPPTGLRAISR